MTLPVRFLGVCIVFLMLGCATGISKQARSQVTYYGTFRALQKASHEHVGEIVMFGGKILRTKAYESASDIAVLHLPLGSGNRPQDGDQSEGRYLIRSEQFLDPAIYQQGRLLTVVGKLTGRETRSIGGFQYDYPVVEAIELKPWPWEKRTSPSFHFGIGVGTWF
jgi:outer membrane lipoprotein